MTKFQIENTRSAQVIGIYDADNEAEAVDLMAVEAGYRNYAAMNAEIPAKDGEILVSDVTYDIEFVADFCMGGAIDNAAGHKDGSYRDWLGGSHIRETYTDFSGWEADELSAEQARVVELMDSSPAFVAAVDDLLQERLDDKIAEEASAFTNAVKEAGDLDDLQEALTAADAYAARYRLDGEHLYDATNLPIFGGDDEPSHRSIIYSWDETNGLEKDSFGVWTISPCK